MNRLVTRTSKLAAITLAGAMTLAVLPSPATAQPAAAPPTGGQQAAGNEILDAAPATRPAAAPQYTFAPGVTIPPGDTKLDWASVKQNYRTPDWMTDGKFGIFIHWGLYAVPAHHNEWYPKHMYSNGGIIRWHAERFGPQDKFGYKDFIPMFTADQFDPDAWADLFKRAGATWVIPTAEHHDRFALWDSKLTRWDAKEMGPKRDLIGDLAKSVRAQGLKYGVSNHRMFAYDFMVPAKNLKHDMNDPAYADFYGPPPAEKSLPDQAFCNDWLARTIELIDLYQPDFLWFDWDGTGESNPVKLQFAAYYFNAAQRWGKQVAFSQKGNTFPVGTGVPSHEKGGRMPKEITRHVWLVDDVISNRSWGYTDAMTYRSPTGIVHQLADAVSKNGTMMLNISPKADGTIPQPQQDVLLSIGRWLARNGEAIYGTRPWTTHADGKIRFTTKGDALYAIHLGDPGDDLTIPALADGRVPTTGDVTVTVLGADAAPLKPSRGPGGLTVKVPAEQRSEHATVLKIVGLKLK